MQRCPGKQVVFLLHQHLLLRMRGERSKGKENETRSPRKCLFKNSLVFGYFLLNQLERVYCSRQHKLPKGNDPSLIFLILGFISFQPFSGSSFFPKILQMLWVAANPLKVFLKPFVSNILPALTPAFRVVIVPEAPRARWCFSILLALGEERIPRRTLGWLIIIQKQEIRAP